MAGINEFKLGFEKDNAKITLGSVSLCTSLIGESVSVAAGNAANVALNKGSDSVHYGSLNLTTDGDLILGLNSAATGSVSISGNGASILSGLSFTGATEVTLSKSDLKALKLVNGSNKADT